MSQVRNGIFAVLAVSATLGAVQFASGQDLTGRRQLAATASEAGVNRSAKADRAAVTVAPGQAETIALRFDVLPDTSVLVRVPVVKDEARNRPPAPAKPGASKLKATVACEPPVSVLTEVAKRLQPGRCVT
jgi:hypothetical protein